jgi:ribonuclease HI
MNVIIFTDGSCKGSKEKKAGYGVYFPNHKYKIIKTLSGNKITNQVAELTACIKGIEKILSNIHFNKIIIYTDSMYTINSITKWANTWKNNNWKKSNNEEILNKKLIKTLYYYYCNLNIEFKHIRAHKNEPNDKNSQEYKLWYGNYMADKYANEGADNIVEKTKSK